MLKTIISSFFIIMLTINVGLCSGLDLEEDYAISGGTQSISYDEPIDISGDFAEKRPVVKKRKRMTAADKMRVMRRKLEKQNMMLVKKQIEQISFQ